MTTARWKSKASKARASCWLFNTKRLERVGHRMHVGEPMSAEDDPLKAKPRSRVTQAKVAAFLANKAMTAALIADAEPVRLVAAFDDITRQERIKALAHGEDDPIEHLRRR